jgi:hypothetical protein
MGTSALVSALNAIPWEGDENSDSSEDEDEYQEKHTAKMGQSVEPVPTTRPKGKFPVERSPQANRAF